MDDAKQPWPDGKWDIGNENNEYCEVCIDHDAGQTVLSLGRHDSPSGREFIISREEMLAVAHLVKQAPAMAEALSDLVTAVDDPANWGGIVTGSVKRARAVLEAAGWRWS